MLKTPILWMALATLALWGCKGNELFQHTYFFENEQWTFADSVDFTFTPEDTITPLNLVFGLRVNEDFKYRNIWVQFKVKSPSGRETTSLREFVLAQTDGTWNVERDGGGYGFEQVLVGNIRLQELGEHRIRAIQYMRQDSLLGVEDVRFTVEPFVPSQ